MQQRRRHIGSKKCKIDLFSVEVQNQLPCGVHISRQYTHRGEISQTFHIPGIYCSERGVMYRRSAAAIQTVYFSFVMDPFPLILNTPNPLTTKLAHEK